MPTTFAAFQQALAKAKAAGETPIQFGNLDKWPGIHEFEELMLQNVSKSVRAQLRLRHRRREARLPPKSTVAAATMLQNWANYGHFTDGYSGLGYDPSLAGFGKGNGVFLISGSWLTADLKKALGKNVGFFLLPPPKGKALATLGGEGLPWAISSKSKNADAAATYLNFITSNSSMQVVANNGQLTATKAKVKVPAGLDTEVYNAWTKANQQDAIVPYLDWATPTMYDTITAAIQELMAGKTSPSAFARTVQSDYSKFHKAEPPSRSSRPPRRCALRTPARLPAAPEREPPGEPRRIALPLPAAGARGLRGVRARAARAHDLALAPPVGRADAGDVGRSRQLQRDPPRPRAPLGVRALARPHLLLRGDPGDARARARRPRCRARGCAGRRASAPCSSCRR